MSHKTKSIYFNRKNDGQEVEMKFTYRASKDISFPEQQAIEMWVKEFGVSMLAAFKMKFPGVVTK